MTKLWTLFLFSGTNFKFKVQVTIKLLINLCIFAILFILFSHHFSLNCRLFKWFSIFNAKTRQTSFSKGEFNYRPRSDMIQALTLLLNNYKRKSVASLGAMTDLVVVAVDMVPDSVAVRVVTELATVELLPSRNRPQIKLKRPQMPKVLPVHR